MSNDPDRSSIFIEMNDARMFVEQAGVGPDVLLVHAGITDCGMWDGQFDALATRFRVTRYDMRGFGRSSAIEREYSHVDDLAGLIEVLGLRRPRVVAASMGARVVIDLALRSPEQFDRMLLVGPAVSGRGFDDPALHACWDQMTAVWGAGDIDRAIDIETRFWVNGPTRTGSGAGESLLERVIEMQRRIVELQPEGDLEIDEGTPASGRPDLLTMPVLIVAGEHDVSDIHNNARAIREAAPDVRIVTVPDTGHLPNIEAVEDFNRLALEFLG